MIDQETEIRLGGMTSEIRHLTVGQTAMSNTLNIVVQDVRELRNEMADISRAVVKLADAWDAKFSVLEAKVDAGFAEMNAKFEQVLEAIRSLRG